LLEGILDGLIRATKSYVKENNLTHFKVNRKKFYNGLIIVCAVRGENFTFGGSFKETLQNETVKKQAKKIVTKLVLDFFENKKELTNKFMIRFDTSQLTNSMYYNNEAINR
jgi:DNA gyrase/topoisomerase IV subunit B